MAKKNDTDLYDRLRASGLRKSVARSASKAASRVDGKGRTPKALRSAIDDLRGALNALESRVPGIDRDARDRGGSGSGGTDRAAAARKAARTRKASAVRRSESARKAARTRARSSGGTRGTAKRGTTSNTGGTAKRSTSARSTAAKRSAASTGNAASRRNATSTGSAASKRSATSSKRGA